VSPIVKNLDVRLVRERAAKRRVETLVSALDDEEFSRHCVTPSAQNHSHMAVSPPERADIAFYGYRWCKDPAG